MNSNDGKPFSMTIINTISTRDAEASRPDPLVTCDWENVAAFSDRRFFLRRIFRSEPGGPVPARKQDRY